MILQLNVVKDDVIELVSRELTAANKKFPLFASSHEGHSVILEELEECRDELINAYSHKALLWQYIKENKPESDTRTAVMLLQTDAVNLAVEAIQLAAMAQKFVDSRRGG